jgi:beta-lactamase regulating signal transducer with metallopeptidase domain
VERLLTLGLANAAAATVLAILIAGAGRVLARRPAVLHCLWMLVLLKLVTPPLFEVPIPHEGILALAFDRSREAALAPDPTEFEIAFGQGNEDASLEPAVPGASLDLEPFGATVAEASATSSLRDLGGGWRGILLGLASLWLAGTAATLVLAGVRITRFGLVLRAAYPADEEVQVEVQELAGRLDLPQAPRAWWIDANMTPMLWAVVCKPRLIIPRALWKRLDAGQRSMLLLHELAHLRRGDHVVRLLELLVTALYWWLPVVWWGRRALRDAEEQCCDAWVVWAFPDGARAYAETLLETVDFLNPSRSPEPLLASGFGGAQHLRRRVTMIMLGTTPRRLGWASGLGAFALSAMLLPVSPSWAQKPADSDEKNFVFLELRDDEAAKPGAEGKQEIELVVTSDGTEDKIKADSLKKASEVLKQRIDALAHEQAGKEQHAAQVKALKQALEELQKAAKSATFDYKIGTPDGKKKTEERKIVIHRLNEEIDGKVTAERKAEIEKARARVDSLRKSLQEKRQELASAERDLAKLSASIARAKVDLRFATPPEAKRDAKTNVEKHIVTRVEKLPLKHFTVTVPDQAHQGKLDAERLDHLEKQLSKLLEEVASLRKQRDENRAGRR